MTTAISFCCAGEFRGKSAGLGQWSRSFSGAAYENTRHADYISELFFHPLHDTGTATERLCVSTKNQRRVCVFRNWHGAAKSSLQTQSAREGPRCRCRGPNSVRTTLRGVSWRQCRGRKEGAQLARHRNSECRTRSDLLGFDERRRPKGNACVVEAPRATTLATRQFHQIAWSHAHKDRTCACWPVPAALYGFVFAASLRIIASRTPASARPVSAAFTALAW